MLSFSSVTKPLVSLHFRSKVLKKSWLYKHRGLEHWKNNGFTSNGQRATKTDKQATDPGADFPVLAWRNYEEPLAVWLRFLSNLWKHIGFTADLLQNVFRKPLDLQVPGHGQRNGQPCHRSGGRLSNTRLEELWGTLGCDQMFRKPQVSAAYPHKTQNAAIPNAVQNACTGDLRNAQYRRTKVAGTQFKTQPFAIWHRHCVLAAFVISNCNAKLLTYVYLLIEICSCPPPPVPSYKSLDILTKSTDVDGEQTINLWNVPNNFQNARAIRIARSRNARWLRRNARVLSVLLQTRYRGAGSPTLALRNYQEPYGWLPKVFTLFKILKLQFRLL